MSEDYGFCWYKNQVKPFIIDRTFKKGRNKGKLQVFLTRGRDSKGTIRKGKKIILESKNIIKHPDQILILE